MKKQILSLFTVLLSVHQLYGQAPHIETETWAEKPSLHSLSGVYSKESAVILSDKRRVEYIDNAKKDIEEYYTIHKIIHINDDRGIEEFNKIYLEFNEDADVVDVKARTILASGRVIEFDKKNIKDVKEQDGNVYKIFAMEGLEKGCEMEYFYTFRRPASFFGKEIVQNGTPILETSFQIIGPERLRFETKPYNFSVVTTDTVLNAKRIAQCSFKETPGAEDEKYASYRANLRRIEYKLSYNDAIHKGERVFTWNELARRLYGIYIGYSDKEDKLVADMVKENGWDKIEDETSKIIAVENYVKKRFSYNDELKSEDGNKLSQVMHDKAGGMIGTMRLYTAVFQNLGINYQYVLTGDRNKFIIDKAFENWDNCDYPIFYFPAEKKFLAPSRPDYRYPWIFPSWAETNALFCKRTTLGTFSSAMAEIKPIEQEDYSKSFNNMESRIEFNSGLDSLTIDAKQIFGGYVAVDYRDIFNFSNDEGKRRVFQQFAKMTANTDHIISTAITNPEFEKGTTNVPVMVEIKTKSGELIEKAGSKLLVKIGQVIGPQVEMYQDKPRQEPVSLEYGHVEERKIDFVIPEGYTISNLNDLKISQTFQDNGALTMGFVSGYELKGNLLSIHIMEEYRKTFYPISQFEQFRKIINASSDFNKVVLVLEKKKG